MKNFALWVVCCAGVAAASGCVADPSAADVDGVQGAEAAAAPGVVDPHIIGQFRTIRFFNTQLCMQPQGRSTADVEIELSPCSFSDPAQNWLLSKISSNDWEVINAQSGKCLYNNVDLPLFNGARNFVQGDCNIFGTTRPASNALWKPARVAGVTQLQSRLGGRDTGFCIDVPNGEGTDHTTMQNWQCNGTHNQLWIVGVE